MKQKIIPLVALVAGLLAFALTHQYLKGEQRKLDGLRAQLYAGARKIYVAAAKRDIPAGSSIEVDDLILMSVYESAAPDRVVRKEDGKLIVGKKTAFHIKANNPILWSDIQGGEVGSLGLAPTITTGMRAISLNIGGTAAVSSMVQPNDRVDVLGTFTLPVSNRPGEFESVTLTVLQDVTVLATGQDTAKSATFDRQRQQARGYSSITLEVTPKEAELLVFAEQSRGRLTLALRNPTDVSYEAKMPTVNFEHIVKQLEGYNENRQLNIRHKRTVRKTGP